MNKKDLLIAAIAVLIVGIAAKDIAGMRRIENGDLTGQAAMTIAIPSDNMPLYQPIPTPQYYPAYVQPTAIAQPASPAMPAYRYYVPFAAPAVAPTVTNAYRPAAMPAYVPPLTLSPWAAIYAALMGAPINDRQPYTPTIGDCDANGDGRCTPCDDSDDDSCRDSVSGEPGIMRRIMGMFVATAHAQGAQTCTISESVDKKCKSVPFKKGACAAAFACIGNSNPAGGKKFTCRARPACFGVTPPTPFSADISYGEIRQSCSMDSPYELDAEIDVKVTMAGGKAPYRGTVGPASIWDFSMAQSGSVTRALRRSASREGSRITIPLSLAATDSSSPVRGRVARSIVATTYADSELTPQYCARLVCVHRGEMMRARYLSQTPSQDDIDNARAVCEEQRWCDFTLGDPAVQSSCDVVDPLVPF